MLSPFCCSLFPFTFRLLLSARPCLAFAKNLRQLHLVTKMHGFPDDAEEPRDGRQVGIPERADGLPVTRQRVRRPKLIFIAMGRKAHRRHPEP
jgi:hypothetical protein